MFDRNALNEEQREAVTHGEGALLLLAGPGSGKTFTITQRIFYLIQECGILPENILVVTFTKEAALSMQRRFHEQSGRIVYPVNFGTFHSVFYRILCDSHRTQSYKLITECQKRQLIDPVLRRLIPGRGTAEEEGRESAAVDAASFLSAISLYKNTGEEAAARELLPPERRSCFRAAMQFYEEEKKRRGLLDFDDMVYGCRNLLRDDGEARKRWQNRFSHILMDEFQDINPMQYEVVRLMAQGGSRLFAVGDDDQSIYGFRGSRPACLKRFEEDFGAKRLCLTVNYRSCKEIVEASCRVIAGNRERFKKELRSASGNGEPQAVKLTACEEREEEYETLACRLRDRLKAQPPDPDGRETLAVLFRTNSHMQGFAAYLSRREVPYHMKERVRSIYGHFIVQDVFAYLQSAAFEATRERILQIRNRPMRYIGREALGRGERAAGPALFQSMIAYYQSLETIPHRRERICAIERLERDLQYLQRLPLYLGVQYILKSVGYEAYLEEKAGPDGERLKEWREICEWLKEEAKQYETVSEWLKAKEIYEEKLRKMSGGRKEEEGAAVQLMTVHASKGLEFDRVWIPDCNEKVFPHGSGIRAADCEEERRIFYVAMTRAKKSLELLYLTGTRERPRFPTRFLNPLLPKQNQRQDPPQSSSWISSSNSQLSRNSSKASAAFSYSSSSSI